MKKNLNFPLTSTHWGTYRVESKNGKITKLHGFEEDPDPSIIGQGIIDVLDGSMRINTPMVRESWYRHGPGSANNLRGEDTFISISWDEAEKLVANELDRIKTKFGNKSIYGGSYGWASAGRFHHAQSQLHRFLNCIGGYTKSLNSYSLAAGEVILPHVIGEYSKYVHSPTCWNSIIQDTDLFVAFGGLPTRNSQISAGGLGRHRTKEALSEANMAGVKFVNISPIKSDIDQNLNAEWLAPRPNSDVSLILGLAHTLIIENLYDEQFLSLYTVGFKEFSDYVMGISDGIEKSAQWAANICDLPATKIHTLARKMANSRTMISMNWSLTRQDHGEQPYWAATALASMLGQIGLPGGGIAFGYSAANSTGLEKSVVEFKALPQGQNTTNSFIPVSRISEMLLKPGQPFNYNGKSYTYPDIKLIYWAGGNPFHHHQDLSKFQKAWQKPDTVIVHEWCWNTLAKHADIVLPCTVSLERNDIAMSPRDPYIIAMEKIQPPIKDAKDDFDILSGIAQKMGIKKLFTGDRDSSAWIQWIYNQSRKSAAKNGIVLPDFKTFKKKGWHKIEVPEENYIMFADFRNDPIKYPLKTPSGKIELYSKTIAKFNYIDCPPHPTWLEPKEWLGNSNKDKDLHMISSQPQNKLHSQFDHGSVSLNGKKKGREQIIINVNTAKLYQIHDGDIVKVYNDRGACLASAVLSKDIRLDVVQMSTGAWLDADKQKDGTLFCRHGNPNVLTIDKGSSNLAQGPIAHSCLVNIKKFEGELPAIRAFSPPKVINAYSKLSKN